VSFVPYFGPLGEKFLKETQGDKIDDALRVEVAEALRQKYLTENTITAENLKLCQWRIRNQRQQLEQLNENLSYAQQELKTWRDRFYKEETRTTAPKG